MLSIDLGGRMGNQLFEYAMVRSIAEKRGLNYWFDQRNWTGKNLFNLDFGIADGVINKIYEEDGSNYNPNVYDVEDFTGFHGYFQNEKYFDHDKARKWFVPTIDVNADFDNVCYIHFRGGDYNVFPWNMYQLPKSYYDEAMALMLTKNPNLRFVMVTDDPNEAHKRFDIEIISNSMEEDFVMLMKAKYLIVSNSSFSWWAGWLNLNNTVIAPSGWFQYNFNRGAFEPKGIKTEKFIWI
jgi:hypothetical protein